MNKSPNIGLVLTPASETNKTFINYRTELSGDSPSSNMMIIDKEIADLKNRPTKNYLTGETAPTQNTVGEVGQRFVNTTDGSWYMCTQVSGDTYTWVQGFSDEERTKLESLNNYDDTKIKEDIANKVEKVDGKGLSTNDYTTVEKEKLATLENYNDTQVKADITKNTDAIALNTGKIEANTTEIATNTADILLKANKSKSYTLTIPTSGWSAEKPYTQTIAVEGMVDDGLPLYDLQAYSELQLDEFAKVTELSTAVGSVTLVAQDKKPTKDMDIRVKVIY